jgi:activator of HSP90 ATPase
LVPSSHVASWAKLEGELRPTGRNSYPVWTPNKLLSVLKEKGGSVHADTVTMPLSSFKQSKARGGENISRFKINPLFFVRSADVENTKGTVTFKLDAVKQNIPDITAKINFKNLEVSEVKKFYMDKI